MKTRSFNYYVFLLAIGLGACSSSEQPTEGLAADEVIPVRTIALATRDTTQVVQATGTFTTDDETALAFKNGGVIEQIHVKEGDSFRKGQLLASLEPTEINATMRQAQLGVEKAERDYHRARQLFLDSVATQEQMENAKTAFEAAKEDAERAAYNLNHTRIYAAFDGYVLQRPTNAGQVVGPGTPILLVTSTGRNGWMLKVGVSDRQWSAIQLGDSAQVTTDASPSKRFAARVSRKSEGVDPQSGTFSIYLKLEEDNGLPPVASGMFGKAEIQLSAKTGAWFIPYEAMLDGDAGSGYVFVTDNGKTARRIPVTIGGMEKDHIVVTGGLENAGSLIVSGNPYLRDGSTITVK